jgi:dienelactone hydrolase
VRGSVDAADEETREDARAALPWPSDLDCAARVLYEGSTLSDYALRTGLSAILAGATVFAAASGGWREERRRLEFYAELYDARDRDAVFGASGGSGGSAGSARSTGSASEVAAVPGRGPGVPGGRVELLRFPSTYVALNPELREDYARHENNALARAQHWRHEDGPRPTLCVIHGFGASPAWLNTAFFSLKDFFAEGWDVLLYTLPFHGSRRGTSFPINGVELFSYGMAHFSEAMIHAVHDFRALVDHLAEQGAPRIGLTGISLGGYVTALLAAVEPRLDFVIPNAAVTWLPPLTDSWFPSNLTGAALRALTRVSPDLLERALALHSPLSWSPLIPKDRLMIVAGLGDRLAPPEQSLLLWEHWDQPELRWFPGSHVLHFGRGEYLDAMRGLMA